MLTACFHFACRAVQRVMDNGEVSPSAGHCYAGHFECISTSIQFRYRAQDICPFRAEWLNRLQERLLLCGERLPLGVNCFVGYCNKLLYRADL